MAARQTIAAVAVPSPRRAGALGVLPTRSPAQGRCRHAGKAPESNPRVKLRPPVNQRARESERVAAGGARATVGVAVGPRDSVSRPRARRAGQVPAPASETPVLTGLFARRAVHGPERPKRPTRKPKRPRVSARASVTPCTRPSRRVGGRLSGWPDRCAIDTGR